MALIKSHHASISRTPSAEIWDKPGVVAVCRSNHAQNVIIVSQTAPDNETRHDLAKRCPQLNEHRRTLVLAPKPQKNDCEVPVTARASQNPPPDS